MRKLTAVLISIAILSVYCANEARPSSDEGLPSSRLPENEQLTYSIRWLGLPVASAQARINGIKNINGRDAYELIITAKTNAFCSKIYNIDDRYVSYLDAQNLYTLRHEVYRREGRYRKEAITDFDQASHKAYYTNLRDGSKKVLDVPAGVQDPVSIAYYFRTVPVKLKDRKDYSVYNNELVYELCGIVDQKTDVCVPGTGRTAAFRLQPYARLKGEAVKKGRAHAYFTPDEKRIPLILVAEGPVFTKLVGYLVKERL